MMLISNPSMFIVSLISLSLFSSIAVHGFPLSPSTIHYVPSISSSHRFLSNMKNPLSTDDDEDEDRSEIVLADDESSSNLNRLSLKLAQENLRALQDQYDFEKQQQNKRSTTHFVKNINGNQLGESPRLSASLRNLVESNPIARAWLKLLLEKLMQEQPAPYIFKYGRRRK